jgi:hypothetical protein
LGQPDRWKLAILGEPIAVQLGARLFRQLGDRCVIEKPKVNEPSGKI